MAENKEQVELKNEKLEKVAGGVTVANGREFTGHVGQYDAVKGEKYFVVSDVLTNDWFAGKCEATYEDSWLHFWTRRVHEISVINSGYGGKPVGETWKYYGDSYTLFKYMNGRTVQQCEDLKKWD